jgi:hypothetical protein
MIDANPIFFLTTDAGKDGYSFVPTGPGKGSGSGVFFIDFSDDYKRCLKLARENLEKMDHLSQLEQNESDWIKEIHKTRDMTLSEKLTYLKVGTKIA